MGEQHRSVCAVACSAGFDPTSSINGVGFVGQAILVALRLDEHYWPTACLFEKEIRGVIKISKLSHKRLLKTKKNDIDEHKLQPGTVSEVSVRRFLTV